MAIMRHSDLSNKRDGFEVLKILITFNIIGLEFCP